MELKVRNTPAMIAEFTEDSVATPATTMVPTSVNFRASGIRAIT